MRTKLMRLVQTKNKTKELDKSGAYALKNTCVRSQVKPGFHIVVSVVSVVSVVRKKFIGPIKLYGNLPYNDIETRLKENNAVYQFLVDGLSVYVL